LGFKTQARLRGDCASLRACTAAGGRI